MKSKLFNTRALATLATLTVIGYGLSWLEFPIFPAAPFLKLDFSTFATLFGGYMFGFPGALIIEGVKQLLIWVTKSSTGGVGEIANFLMATAFVLVPTVLYRFKKGIGWVVLGLSVGCVCQIGASLLCNRYINFPLFMGAGAKDAFDSLWVFVLAFNAIKSVAISILVFFLYKRLSFIIKRYFLEKPKKAKLAAESDAETPNKDSETVSVETETEKNTDNVSQ